MPGDASKNWQCCWRTVLLECWLAQLFFVVPCGVSDDGARFARAAPAVGVSTAHRFEGRNDAIPAW